MHRNLTHIDAPRFIHRGALLSAALGVCLSAWGCGGGDTTVEGDPPIIPSVAAIAPGDSTCPAGGVRVSTGVDDNRNGVLDSDEVDATSSVCNGSDIVGLEDNVLVRTVALDPGVECAAGGRRLDIGLDNGDGDGTAANATLEDGEVDTSFLDCDDAPMVVGVQPPPGAAGAFVLDTHGGSGTAGQGGTAGDLLDEQEVETADAYLMMSETGVADASCAPPTLTLDLGDTPAVVNADLTLPLVAAGNEGTLANGALYAQTDVEGILVWDATNVMGTQATGLRVASGVTLTVPANNLSGDSAVLRFDADVDVLGTIATAPDGLNGSSLSLYGERVVLGSASTLNTTSGSAGGAAAGAAGEVYIRTYGELLALGTINAQGADGASGGGGGRVDLNASGQVFTNGAITTTGGDATVTDGGDGGDVFLRAESRLVCNGAAIDASGGSAPLLAGDGGVVNMGADCVYGVPLEVRSAGAVRTRGGAQTGACGNPSACRGGQGGRVWLTAGYGGAIATSGGLDTRGGSSAGGSGGSGGDINLSEGYAFDTIAVVRRYDLSGSITTFGGDGADGGGGGGDIDVENMGTLGSATRFLGYASALLSGGVGGTNGGHAGSIFVEPSANASEGGLGLYIFGTDVTATGGAAATGRGGSGGDIVFAPSVGSGGPGNGGARAPANSPDENMVILANATLHGGDGAEGGRGGDIKAPSGCAPNLVTTGIRVDGAFNLDGGAGTSGRGGDAGQLDLATLRGAASLAGSISANAGDSATGDGGSFYGAVLMGTPATLSASVTVSGGSGAGAGGSASDVVVMSFGGPSTATGVVTVAGGTGGVPADNGYTGSFRVDSGNTCVGP
jgi:hypothetical protein